MYFVILKRRLNNPKVTGKFVVITNLESENIVHILEFLIMTETSWFFTCHGNHHLKPYPRRQYMAENQSRNLQLFPVLQTAREGVHGQRPDHEGDAREHGKDERVSKMAIEPKLSLIPA